MPRARFIPDEKRAAPRLLGPLEPRTPFSSESAHSLVVRIAERVLDPLRLGEVQVDVARRNRAGEPLRVDLVDLARLVHRGERAIDDRLELRVLATQHD